MKLEATEKRSYRKTTRAISERATGEAILAAAYRAFGSQPFDRVTLQRIADDSGVTVQTVIRRFGSKEQLFETLVEQETQRVLSSRSVPEGASIQDAVEALVLHYEHDGDVVLNFVGQEHVSEPVRHVVELGRRVHREWVERHLASLLEGGADPHHERLIYAAIAATDLGTWKLLRRDLGLDQERTTAVMVQLLQGLKRR